MGVIVRPAVKNDAPTIAEFAIRLFAQHHDYDPERFADIGDLKGAEQYYGSRIDAKTAEVLVAQLDKKVVGFAYLEYEPIDYAMLLANAAWLHDLYVAEKARGSRTGKLLIEAAGLAAYRLRAEKLVLTVAAKNSAAHEFFRRMGFRDTMSEMTLNLTNRTST